MIDPERDTIRRVALFLFIAGGVIALFAYRAASGYQAPESQMRGVW